MRKFPAAILAFTLGILGLLEGIFSNIATNAIPASIVTSARFSWPALILVSCINIGIAVWQASNEKTQPMPMQSTTTIHTPASIEKIACPYCQKYELQVQGKGRNSLILECKNCDKFCRVIYENNTLHKLIIPGIGALIGIIEIAEYLHHHNPDELADLLWHLFDSF